MAASTSHPTGSMCPAGRYRVGFPWRPGRSAQFVPRAGLGGGSLHRPPSASAYRTSRFLLARDELATRFDHESTQRQSSALKHTKVEEPSGLSPPMTHNSP